MVEAGLGVSLVPLMPDGSVTRGRRVGVRPMGDRIRAIRSGVLYRRGEPLSADPMNLIRVMLAEGELQNISKTSQVSIGRVPNASSRHRLRSRQTGGVWIGLITLRLALSEEQDRS